MSRSSSPIHPKPAWRAALTRALIPVGVCLGITATLGALGALSLVARDAEARRPQPVTSPPISQALKGLKWGTGHKEIIKTISVTIKERYDDLVKSARDDVAVDQIRQQQRAELKVLEDSYVTFTGQRTGYEVSLVKDDFAHNNSETMLRYDEGPRQRYYFFRHDKLWKMMVVYPSTDEAGFQALTDKVAERYGRPHKTNWETPYGGARRMVQAIWQDEETQLVVEDKSAFYSRYVMRFMSVAVGLEIEELHSQRRDSADASKRARPGRGVGVDIFTQELENHGVVDQITGTKHEVNLDRLKDLSAEGE
jgi:hypothetical protein